MNVKNFFKTGNASKVRKLHSLPNLNNDKFKGYSMQQVREMIEHDVCEYFEVPLITLWSKSRKRPYVRPRHLLMYLLVHYTTYSLKNIAAFYNREDHTSALRAQENITNFLTPSIQSEEKQIIKRFLYQYGYKVYGSVTAKEQKSAFVIDAHY